MEPVNLCKHGILLSQVQGFLKRSWQRKYCALYKLGKQGIQRLEVFENEDSFRKDNSPSKIIPLNECIKVSELYQKNLLNLFEIRTKTQCFQFCTESGVELLEWISAIQTAAFRSYQHEVEKPADDVFLPTESETMEEVENSIYSGVTSRETYNVTVIETAGSKRCGLEGHYQLILTETSISLAHVSDNQQRLTFSSWFIFSWPYRYIRRYGRGKESFSFEAGRKCQTGPGLFSFATGDSTLPIFQNVGYHMQSLRRMSNESNNNVDLCAAAIGTNSHDSYFAESSHFKSMMKKEAPIAKPPRKCNQVASEEPMYENTSTVLKSPVVKSCNNSFTDVKPAGQGSIEIHDIIQSNIANLYPTVVNFAAESAATDFQEETALDLYDEPEERTDAWKTLGRGDNTPPAQSEVQNYSMNLESLSSATDSTQEHLYCKLNALHLRGVADADDESDYSHLQHIMPSSPQTSIGPASHMPAHDSGKATSTHEIPPVSAEPSAIESPMTRYENVLMPEITSSLRSPRSGRTKPIVASDPAISASLAEPYVPRQMPSSHHEGESIEHVMQNDAVYAQVIRKSTKI